MHSDDARLILTSDMTVRAENAGLFLSRGVGQHPDRVIESYELVLVRNGCLKIQEAGHSFAVNKDETLLLWPGRRHVGMSVYDANLSFYWIHFTVSDTTKESAQVNPTTNIQQHSVPMRPQYIAEIFHRFMDDQETGMLIPAVGDMLVTIMLHEAGRRTVRPVDQSSETLAALADRYIAANLDKALTASILAEHLNYSPGHLERMYVRARGVSVTRGIHMARIREARSLLRESTMNVDQVAIACGFADPGFFRRIFRRHMGMTPREYRALHSHVHVNSR